MDGMRTACLSLAVLPALVACADAVDLPAPPQPQVVAEEAIPGTLDVERWRLTGPVELAESAMAAPGGDRPALRMRVGLSYDDRATRSYTALLYDYETPADWSAYNRLVLPLFVEPSATPRGGGISVLLSAEDQPRRPLGPFIVARGEWHEVEWDVTPIPRERITTIMVVTGVHAHNPGEAEEAIYHLGPLSLRRVEPETKVHGWELQPHRVAFSHVGYPPGAEKTAIFPDVALTAARLLRADTGETAWEGALQPAGHARTGRFLLADFSQVREPGSYVLVADGADGPLATEPFPIADDVYVEALQAVLDFYRAERCGDNAPGYHTACHLDDARVEPYPGMDPERFAPEVRALFGTHADCSGGWHDAGDVAKFAYQEYNSAYQMLRLYERGLRYRREAAERDAVLDEAIWGIGYALNSLLPTGRNCDRPESVRDSVWTDGLPGNDDDRIAGMTTWMTVERWIRALAANAAAARVLADEDPELAARCLDQARAEAEAYLTGALRDWRDTSPSVIKYSSVGTSFLELFRTTGDERYATEAVRCGNEVVACQEQGLGWNDLGITGFFYGDLSRSYPYAGGGTDGRQACFLAELCRALPDHPDWMRWYAALRIYADFYARPTAEYLAPFGVPAHTLHGGPDQPRRYWEIVSVLGDTGSRPLDFQFDRLVPVGDRSLVRICGANPSLSMHGAALAAAADLCRSAEAEAMAHRCFAWLLGRNPFSRSQVWAIGHRYREQPHYVAMHDEMRGSIGCKGIDGRLDGDPVYHDEPFSDPLPRCVINEVHIAAAARFLSAGVELGFPPTVAGTVTGEARPDHIVARYEGTEVTAATAAIDQDGRYRLSLPSGGTYELQCGEVRRALFVASAARLEDYDLDLDGEIEVGLTCPERVRGTRPFTARLTLRRLGAPAAEPAGVRIELRLHNLACDDALLSVEVPATGDAEIDLTLTPERADEPFIAMAIPDGCPAKRAEAVGMVTALR